MMTMVRLAVCILLGTALVSAQNKEDLFTKAPPAMEAALSERIKTFFELQIAGKFRAADQYVAEESKDEFYSADKPDCKAWKLDRIQWKPDFKSARAMITCDTTIMSFAGPLQVKRPIVGNWKEVDGKWFWFVPPQPKEMMTPFGAMKPGPGGTGSAGGFRMPTVQDVVNQVKVDKREVVIETSRKFTAEVVISNTSPGEANVTMEAPTVAGLSIKLDRNKISSGSIAKVLFQYEPTAPKPVGSTSLSLRIEPFAQNFEVNIIFR